MNKALEIILREADTRHDLDRVGVAGTQESIWKTLTSATYATGNVAKHVLRGGAYGAFAGALTAVITGSSISDGARNGAGIGLFIDVCQYVARYLLTDNATAIYKSITKRP